MKNTLLIIDDHRIIRDGLKAIFKKNRNFQVVADFDNEEDLFNFLSIDQCDIILMDIHLNSSNGIELTRRVKKEYPGIKVIMHTMSDDPINIKEARAIGAEGYILKSSGQKDLEKALEIVSDGGIFYIKEGL
jgi:DNA-binding NarL/FixJ family response regulator